MTALLTIAAIIGICCGWADMNESSTRDARRREANRRFRQREAEARRLRAEAKRLQRKGRKS